MSIKLNTTLGLMILFLSASLANADGGLIFLEKNLQSQQEVKAHLEKNMNHSNIKQKCK
ncbi:hypothetical protein [Acinetobacter sp. NIPH 2699]|uniref:hypothetical protein n=1 Tax=Acinetobacter sp. NIPH 2699 TaxID=2923433 RepID=UPI001F4A1C76|nr:hypothetical protein [Acinetobacter sp. NIPH 2699]MCH7335800.1 hypothetical protein [Acinetobacter sp. NIPH 2699]